jgi:hypothetical protein
MMIGGALDGIAVLSERRDPDGERPGTGAADVAAFAFGRPAPDAVVIVLFEGVSETLSADWAYRTDCFRSPGVIAQLGEEEPGVEATTLGERRPMRSRLIHEGPAR